MAKKPIKTLSLVAMASSLEAQSQAVLNLISRIDTAHSLASQVDAGGLRRMLAEIKTDADRVSGILWPEGS